jgi:hypothetical protein
LFCAAVGELLDVAFVKLRSLGDGDADEIGGQAQVLVVLVCKEAPTEELQDREATVGMVSRGCLL